MANKVFLKWTGALKNVADVKAHIKYIGFRSQEIGKENKGVFSKDENHVDYKKFIERIENNPALKHGNSIKAQKIMFSLKEVDYNAYKRSGKNYKDLVRTTLNKYEKKHGVELDWVANIHEAEGHPHCHVVIKGVSDVKDKDGRYKRIIFDLKNDFKDMKNNFDVELEKNSKYLIHEKFDLNKVLKGMTRSFEDATKEIGKDPEKEDKKLSDKSRKKKIRTSKDLEEQKERERSRD